MADRFAELLEQGKKGRLTPKETEELAGLLNAPLLEPLKNPPLGFVSKHAMTATDIAPRIEAIDWFAHCGEPAKFDLTMEIKPVKTWPLAMNACQEDAWEYATLEARNQFTLALHHGDRERYPKWNDLTDPFKTDVVTPLSEKVWTPFQERHGLDIKFVHRVQWDVLAAMMENAYMSSNHGSYFFLELLTVYEAGHFPCGWSGEWPKGELVVF